MTESSPEELAETLTLQLSEVEMLSSMFANPGEFVVDDGSSLAQIQAFLDGHIPYEELQSRVGFTVKLRALDQQTLELVCRLPHEYPSVLPQVFTRASALTRQQHRAISEAVQAHLETLQLGELIIGPLIEWFQEHAPAFLKQAENLTKNNSKTAVSEPKNNLFSRMWIYSHHIYSKIKRKDILEFSDELNLSGFCMPGKPGIIVIEGYNDDVEDFWGRIRRMQWKKLTMKEKEDWKIGAKTVDDFRKFQGFEEKYFEPRQGKGRNGHADRGLLFQYLEERGFGKMFNMYFHVDGKLADGEDD